MGRSRDSIQNFRLLSELVLSDYPSNVGGGPVPHTKGSEHALRLSQPELEDLEALAASNHVILRSFPQLGLMLEAAGEQSTANQVENAVQREKARIDHALGFLEEICSTLEKDGCPVTVIKSLDHWPDLGSDLDLYTDAQPAELINAMKKRFNAQPAARSWGDRLANKWNFIVPGLPELVEVHVSRLGQTGEQVAITDSLVKKSRHAEFAGYTLRVPAPEDRLMISTLQRMYRHFYLRLCDVADTARLVESGTINYVYLRSLARSAGLWDGLATYMVTVAGYVKYTSGRDLPLPELVTKSAQFGSELVHFRRKFLRIPIFPQAAKLYAAEWRRLLLNGELQNTFRLSLLPGLAAAAALEFKLTGSDKGIW